MLAGDPFVAMGAAALKTSRIRLGTGVLVPTNRIPAVTASAFATLNAMAPGRGCIFFASDEGQSNLSGVPSSSSARSTSMRTAKPFLSGSRSFSGWIKRVQTSSGRPRFKQASGAVEAGDAAFGQNAVGSKLWLAEVDGYPRTIGQVFRR